MKNAIVCLTSAFSLRLQAPWYLNELNITCCLLASLVPGRANHLLLSVTWEASLDVLYTVTDLCAVIIYFLC